ncbi:MAG: hypothetical protein ACPLKS_07890, partial [Caldisericum exile]|uniref:hypothetical protein n=1 Tax=Caldisericum exile TaxID=693075 RepID=UPI003C73FF0C
TQCLAPNACASFNLTAACPTRPECNPQNITVTICYQCAVTHLEIEYKIISIRGYVKGCACANIVFNSVISYLAEHVYEFCGIIPCSQGTRKFKIYYPVCADLWIKGPPEDYEYFFVRNANCDVFCYYEYEWCWDEIIGKTRLQRISEAIPTNIINCNYVDPPDYDPNFPDQWRRVQCQLIASPCNEGEGWEP